MTQRGFTSLEQARALLGLGLKPETADMHFFIDESVKVDMRYSKEAEECYKNTSLEYLPCWSLNALTLLMQPIYVEPTRFEAQMRCSQGKYYFTYRNALNHQLLVTKQYELPIDAAVEMVTKLLKQN